MNEQQFLGALIVISVALCLAGFGYIFVFGPIGLNLSPSDSDQGIQMSPSNSCVRICEEGYFQRCEAGFESFSCGVSCKGTINSGLERGKLPIFGKTPCEMVSCGCR